MIEHCLIGFVLSELDYYSQSISVVPHIRSREGLVSHLHSLRAGQWTLVLEIDLQ